MEKGIKNCRGVKKCNDSISRTQKQNQRKDFRIILRFKENEIYESNECSIIKKIKNVFLNEIINDQY